MVVAIVLAGGYKDGLISGRRLPVNEALIRIGKRYMIEYVVEALQASPYIENIVLAGPLDKTEKIYKDCSDVTLVQSGDTVIDTFKNAFASIPLVNKRILVVTADIPLLTTCAVNDFLDSCLQREGDLFYPVVSKETNENKYPGVRRTYVTLKDGIFTGGNLFFVNPTIVEKCLPVAEKLVRFRKKPLRLASYIGWGILLRYVLGLLSLEDAERAVSRMIGIKGVAVVSPFPEIGIDVDKESDLDLAKKMLCS